MYVVEVIPMRRGIPLTALSYFSSVPYPRGTILSIPIRNTATQGVVVSHEEVSVAKAALRSATFSLRRLPTQDAPFSLPEGFLKTAEALAEHYASSVGAVLFSLLPHEVRDGVLPLTPSIQKIPQGDVTYEVLEEPYESRVRAYQSTVRTAFANGMSVVIVVPTREEGEHLAGELEEGIKERVAFIHGGRAARALRTLYARIAGKEVPMLIVATPQYAFFNRSDAGVFIIERSRSFAYRSRSRPYLDFRHALALYAKGIGARLISADTLVRSEDEELLERGAAIPFDERPKRMMLPGTLKTIAMKDKPDGTTPFMLFSPTLLSAIEKTRAARGRTFIFSARRGLAPIVACADCGAIMRCPQSGSPLSLERRVRDGVEERWFVSSVSGFRMRAADLCPSCGSWRLRERGIGIQHVYDELREHTGDENILLFDHLSAATHKKASAIRDEFYRRKNAVLIGTASALPYLREPVDVSAVVSLDALRAIPSWRQEEEALGTLLALREKTLGYVFVQIRGEEDDLIRHAQKGTIADFHHEELTSRKQFAYPPYVVFIHLAWKKVPDDPIGEEIARTLSPFDVAFYGPPAAEDIVGYALIRVPYRDWPKDALVDALRTLPPSVRITINPDRIA